MCPRKAIRLPSLALRSLQAAPPKGSRRQASNLPARYQILPQGYSVCLVFLKLFERVYAPLTAGRLSPVSADAQKPLAKTGLNSTASINPRHR